MIPLMQAGKLPNLSRFVKEGAWGNLIASKPVISPPIWTSIATGVTRERHNIRNFIEEPEGTYLTVILGKAAETANQIPVNSGSRKVKAFWNLATDYDTSIISVGWWASWPAEYVNGVIVSDRIGRDLDDTEVSTNFETYPKAVFNQVYPVLRDYPDLTDEEMKFFTTYDKETANQIMKKNFRLAGDKPMFDVSYLADSNSFLLTNLLWKKYQPTIMALYVNGIDVLEHTFFAYSYIPALDKVEKIIADQDFDPSDPEYFSKITNPDPMARVLENFYIWTDQQIGNLLKSVDPKQTTLIIVSDHGFGFFRSPEQPNQLKNYHITNGIIMVWGQAIKAGFKLKDASIYDVMPTMLALANQPVAQDLDGRVLTEAIKETFLKKYPIQDVATYGAHVYSVKDIPEKSRVDEEMLARLRGLGYIE